jgi:hypothetical protein
MAATIIELKAKGTHFFSQLDESAFFGWLKKLQKCPWLSEIEGKGDTLSIRVVRSKVDEYALRELLALFRRYGISMKQLSALDKQEFAEWFHDRNAYWHESVFGS